MPAFVAKDTSVISAVENLETIKGEFSKANAVAAARGFSVKVGKLSTVVTKIEPAKAPVLKPVKKMKKVVQTALPKSTKTAKPALKVVATTPAKAKTAPNKKAA